MCGIIEYVMEKVYSTNYSMVMNKSENSNIYSAKL